MAADGPTVVDRPEQSRFTVDVDGEVAELTYRQVGDRLIIQHTGVPDAVGGRGIGGQLVRAAVDRAAAEHLTIVPLCPYASGWLRRHPDETARVSVTW